MAHYEQGEYGGNAGAEYGDDQQSQQQRPPPSKYQVRPQVDPDAEGEVDPNL